MKYFAAISWLDFFYRLNLAITSYTSCWLTQTMDLVTSLFSSPLFEIWKSRWNTHTDFIIVLCCLYPSHLFVYVFLITRSKYWHFQMLFSPVLNRPSSSAWGKARGFGGKVEWVKFAVKTFLQASQESKFLLCCRLGKNVEYIQFL